MKYMKKLVAFAAVALAITSCNDNFEEGPGAIHYPSTPDLGIYVNDYTEDGGTSYTVNLYVTEENDTVLPASFRLTMTSQCTNCPPVSPSLTRMTWVR